MSETNFWIPIFSKDGNEFFFQYDDHKYTEEHKARQHGMGMMFVECILWGIKYVEAREIDISNCPHLSAKIEDNHVAIISGPLFDKAL
jgi:hypothetical protein